jgi:hypothetical protein
MSETQALRVPPPRTAGASAAAAGRDRRGRAVRQFWSLLHAQALLDGTARGPGDVIVSEDDRQRLAARRAR